MFKEIKKKIEKIDEEISNSTIVLQFLKKNQMESVELINDI